MISFLEFTFRYSILWHNKQKHLDRNLPKSIWLLRKPLLLLKTRKVLVSYLLKHFQKETEGTSNKILSLTFSQYESELLKALPKRNYIDEIVLFKNNNGIQLNIILLLIGLTYPDIDKYKFRKISNKFPELSNNLFRVLKTLAISEIIELLLHKTEYNKLILFNDHSPYHRAAYLKSQKQGLAKIYIQHAPVNSEFPELYFDLNILFSQHSVDSYMNNSNMPIFQYYDLRLKRLKNVPLSDNFNNIVICINDIDNPKEVKELIQYLQNFGYKIRVRPHPLEIKHYTKIFGKSLISPSKSLIEDLRWSRNFVLNETSVALEILFAGGHVYKASFLTKKELKIYDNYDFIKHNLNLNEVWSKDELISKVKEIQNKPTINNITYFTGVNTSADIDDKEKVLETILYS